jgi:hypothetical protein
MGVANGKEVNGRWGGGGEEVNRSWGGDEMELEVVKGRWGGVDRR